MEYKWTDPATGQPTPVGVGTPTPITPDKNLYIGATNWQNLQKQYTPYQLSQATQKVGNDIYWNPNVNIADISKIPTIPNEASVADLGQQAINPQVSTPQSIMESTIAGVDTSIKGLESLIAEALKPTPAETQIKPTTDKIDTLSNQMAQKPADFQAELDKYGFQTNVKELQQLNTQISSAKAEYDKLAEQVRNQPIQSRIIGGTMDRLQRQAAIELGGLSAVAQAYQGNVNMAMDIASKTIEIKYEPILFEIENQKFQLEQIYSQLDREEKRRADTLNLALTERERLIAEEKEKEKNINQLAISIAENGVDAGTLNKIMNAKSYEEAIEIARPYLQETPNGLIPLGNGNFLDVENGVTITPEQFNDTVIIPETSRIASVHNNPGNLMYVGQEGASKGEPKRGGGYWAYFETPEAGYEALKRQIELDASRDLTLEKFINKYAPATENNTTQYLSDAIRELGVGSDTKISDINKDALAKFIAKKESGTIVREPVINPEITDKERKSLEQDFNKVGLYDNMTLDDFIALTPEQRDFTVKFKTEVNKEIKNLAEGGDWGDSWNRIKNMFPDVDNEIIDEYLRKEQFFPAETDTRNWWQRFWGINK